MSDEVRNTENEIAAVMTLAMAKARPEDIVEAARTFSPTQRAAWCHAMRAYDIDFEGDEVRRLQGEVERWRAQSKKRKDQRDRALQQRDEVGFQLDAANKFNLAQKHRQEAYAEALDAAWSTIEAQGGRDLVEGLSADLAGKLGYEKAPAEEG